PQPAHRAAHLNGRARIPALAQHLVQPRGAEPRVLREGLADEREIRVERGGATAAAPREDRVPVDGGGDRLMMDAEVGGDGAHAPVLGVVEAADLGALRGADHGGRGTRDGWANAVEG